MKLKELFLKCDRNTLDFLKNYIFFIHKMVKDGKLKDEYLIHYDDKTYDSLEAAFVYYFLVLIFFFEFKLKEYMNIDAWQVALENGPVKGAYLDAHMRSENSEDGFFDLAYNILRLNKFFDGIVKKEAGTYCVERMLINIVNKYKSDNIIGPLIATFNIDGRLSEIEEMARNREIVDTQNIDYLEGSAKLQMEEMFERFANNAKEREKEQGLRIAGININLPKEDDEEDVRVGTNININIPNTIELTREEFKENPVVGREVELRKIGASLLDREKSVLLYGKPGVGKTTLVRGIAYQIQKGISHEELRDYRIYETSAAELISGTKYRGSFEKKALQLIDNIISSGKALLFIDEIHALMGIGLSSNSESVDVSNIFKPYLGDGRLKLIGGTTDLEYKYILANPAFARRFIGIEVPELSDEDVEALLKRTIDSFKKIEEIGFLYPDEIKEELVKVYLEMANEEFQSLDNRLYNPDLALTMLRMGYNFARYDKKTQVDADALIEGVSMIKEINEMGREHFMKRVREITK